VRPLCTARLTSAEHREIERLLQILRPEWRQQQATAASEDESDKFAEGGIALPTL